MDNYDEDGYSDGGLDSDEEVMPPSTYNLNRRRNAFCVTSANTEIDDGEPPPVSILKNRRNAIYGFPSPTAELIPEEAKLLAFMKQQGVELYFPPAKESVETDYAISSDEEEVHYSKHSDKSQQTSFLGKPSVQTTNEPPQEAVTNWKAIADAEARMKKKLPGFLHHQQLKPAYQRPLATTMRPLAEVKMEGPPVPRTVDAGIGPVNSLGRMRQRPGAPGNPVNTLKENSNFRVM